MDKRLKFKCCKPLLTSKKCDYKTRYLTDSLIEKLKFHGCKNPLDTTMQICTRCRLQFLNSLSKPTAASDEVLENIEMEQPSTSGVQSMGPVEIESEPIVDTVPSATSLESASSADSVINRISMSHNIETFNTGIIGIHVSPISAKRMRSAYYPAEKSKEIISGLKRHIFNIPETDNDEIINSKANDYDEIMAQLKEKIADPECTKQEKIQVLSVLPKSWSVQKIIDEFRELGVSSYTAAKVRKIKLINHN